jgi:hypothetical protein
MESTETASELLLKATEYRQLALNCRTADDFTKGELLTLAEEYIALARQAMVAQAEEDGSLSWAGR